MKDREQFQKNRNRDKRKRQKDKDTSFIVPQAWGKRARWERRGLFGGDNWRVVRMCKGVTRQGWQLYWKERVHLEK